MEFLIFFITRLAIIALILISIYFIIAMRILYIHPYYIYQPRRQIDATPSEINLEYREIFLKTKDGISLNAWFIPAPEQKAVVLHCHGNFGNISDRLPTIKIYNDMGFGFFLFDYRGYGQSKGRPSEKGTYLDAETAWNYLVRDMGIAPADIVISGHSLGGAIAAYLAGKVTPKALIIEGTFTSMSDMGKLIYPYFPMRLLVRHRYNNKVHLKKIGCPIMIIHSPNDDVVPFYMGKELFLLANPPKWFLQIHGSHNDAIRDSRELYTGEIKNFLSQINNDKINNDSDSNKEN